MLQKLNKKSNDNQSVTMNEYETNGHYTQTIREKYRLPEAGLLIVDEGLCAY